MKKSIYLNMPSGVWITLPNKVLDLACCDCSLVHQFVFRIHKGKLQIKGYRNNRATGQLRRKRK